MKETTLNIEGMTCEGCAQSITKVLSELPGVQVAEVSVADKRARIEFDPDSVSTEDMKLVITQAGFESP